MQIHSPEGKENQIIQVDEMKVQVPDFTENLTQLERDLFHFLTSLTQEKNHALTTVSFFNELDIGKEPCSKGPINM